jgi:hypothetical protein
MDRFDAELTDKVHAGNLIRAHTTRGAIFLAAIVGYGGVARSAGDDNSSSLTVIARGTNWQLLTKELVKGTAELICLHGLNTLADDVYEGVMDAADRIEFEPWMLQSGGELWRRLLALIPPDRPVAHLMMHLARLPARSLHSLIIDVIERPQWARELIGGLGDVP